MYMSTVRDYVLKAGGPAYAGFAMAIVHNMLNLVTDITKNIPIPLTTGGVGYVYADATGEDRVCGVAKGIGGGMGGDLVVGLVL